MKKEGSIEERLIRSMGQAVEIAEGTTAPSREYDLPLTAKHVSVPPAPEYDARSVIAIRNSLKLSQAVFAQALNVSSGTVRSWEQGEKPPQGPSRRLLEIAAKSPETILGAIVVHQPEASRPGGPNRRGSRRRGAGRPRERMIDYDLELRHHNDVLRRAYGIRASDRVLDVGCGTGQTTREAARLATAGTVLGIDRSEAMIERARSLARAAGLPNIEHKCADVEKCALPRERFDVAISRFGTMFFDRPVAAFSNIRSALRQNGRLVMMVWQQHDRNEWATSIERALAPDAARVALSPTARQPFSLGDPNAVRRILDSAGFAAPTFDEVRAAVYYGSDVDAAFEFVARFAIVQETAARLDVHQRERALDRLRHLLAAHRRADGVWFDSRAWIVAARRS